MFTPVVCHGHPCKLSRKLNNRCYPLVNDHGSPVTAKFPFGGHNQGVFNYNLASPNSSLIRTGVGSN